MLFEGKFKAERSIFVDEIRNFIDSNAIDWDSLPNYQWPEYTRAQ